MTQARDLDGKTLLITGASAGIGKATAEAVCARGARVHLACRSPDKAAPFLRELQQRHGERAATLLELDLAELTSVRRAAQRFLDTGERLDVLINNAGVAGIRGLTKDGFELTFGTNHLGHFLLTRLLLERIKQSAPARVVTVSSASHKMARGIPFDDLRRPTPMSLIPAYAVSKLANNLFSAELSRRLAGTGVTTYAVHPGVVQSEIWRPIPEPLRTLFFKLRRMVTNEEGARTSIWCATAEACAHESGRYYAREKEARASQETNDLELARKLWEWSERACGL